MIYTDGSFIKNSSKSKYKIAGYGIVFNNCSEFIDSEICDEYEHRFEDLDIKFKFGAFLKNPITNQRAELYAIYKALFMVNNYCSKTRYYPKTITIYSDSMYSINIYTKWYKIWIKNGWIGSNNEVKNTDIIKPTLSIINKLKKCSEIKFVHIRAHTGYNDLNSKCNDIADKLANLGSSKAIDYYKQKYK